MAYVIGKFVYFMHHAPFFNFCSIYEMEKILHTLSLSFALLKDKVFGLLRKIYSQYKKAEKSKFWMLQ